MAGPASRDPKRFSIFKTAAQEAAESRDRNAWENEGGAPFDLLAAGAPPARSEEELEAAICDLVFALYAEDVRMGIVREGDILDPGGALSIAGGSRYHRRAAAILRNLSGVSDGEILEACAAEPADTPRGAAARAERRLRGLVRS